MKHGCFASIMALLAGAGLAAAQPTSPYLPQAAGTGTVGVQLPGNGADPAPAVPFDGRSAAPPGLTGPGAPGAPPPGPTYPYLGAWSRPDTAAAQNWWVAPEYLLWWVRKGPVPLTILTPVSPLDQNRPDLVFGNTGLDYGSLSGGRLTAGAWFDNFSTFGVEARGFLLEQGTTSRRFTSGPGGFPPLAIPFFNAALQQEDSFPVSVPGAFTGTLSATSSSRLWGAEADLTFNLYRDSAFTFDVLAGFRYLDLREDLTIGTSFAPLPAFDVAFGGGFFDPPNLVTTQDRFAARNHYYGGQLGFRTEYRFGDFSAGLAGKLAAGDTHEVIDVSGTTTLRTGLAPRASLPGGIFALPTNSGHFANDDFAVVSEVEVKVGYLLARNVSIFAGYSFTYWSSVARPGDQINRNLNPGAVPSAADFGLLNSPAPRPIFRTTDFWAQGVSFGLEFRY